MALVWEDAHTVALGPESGSSPVPEKSTERPPESSSSNVAFPNPLGVFRTDVKNQWVDAIFGPSCFQRSNEAPSEQNGGIREGVGLAGIKSYVAYEASIPAGAGQSGTATAPPSIPESPTQTNRLGITLCRLPLGLYVRAVDVTGEAYSAGIVPGSVLIEINGLVVLGEPSHKILERFWQYEYEGTAIGSGPPGGGSDDNSVTTNESVNRGGSAQRCTFGGVQCPIALRFIRDGRIYSALLLSKAPFGISWAPCGNFALVQKAYSFAEAAGVRRGCLVVAVNDRSLRGMDHIDTAEELKRLFACGVS